MAAKVQLALEQRLPELRDLELKGLLSKTEIADVVRRRTQHETALIRRGASPDDVIAYVEYEKRLEKLRSLRARRIKDRLSDYSIPRFILGLYTRGVRRFPDSLELWRHYIAYTLTQPSAKAVATALASAIALHPSRTEFWIFAARWEADGDAKDSTGGGNIDGARKLLMRALRFDGRAVEVWLEWLRIELAFAERLRKRWAVLGASSEAEVVASKLDIPLVEGEDADTGMDAAIVPAMSAAQANQQPIIEGALVRVVIAKGIEATVEVAEPMLELVRALDSPLRTPTLEHVYATLLATRSSEPVARAVVARRHIADDAAVATAEVVDEAYVAALGRSIADFSAACKELRDSDDMLIAFLAFLSAQIARTSASQPSLEYVVGSARAAVKSASKRRNVSVGVSSALLDLLVAVDAPLDERRSVAVAATTAHPRDELAWLALARVERALAGSGRSLDGFWRIALGHLPGSRVLWQARLDDVVATWRASMHGVSDVLRELDDLQRDAAQASAAVRVELGQLTLSDLVDQARITALRLAGLAYTDQLATCSTALLRWCATSETDGEALEAIHTRLCARSDATTVDRLAQLEHLLKIGKAPAAMTCYSAARTRLHGDALVEFDAAWVALCE